MPRPRPPHLHREVTRHGKAVWYVRVGKGPRVRIKAPFGTPDFDAEYRGAIEGTPRPKNDEPARNTLAWLIARYRETAAWRDLSLATRRQRENIFRQVIATAGTKPYSHITRKVIDVSVSKRAATPYQARHFLDTMRGLFRWALKSDLVTVEPTAGVSNPKGKKTEGFRPWTEDDVIAYERRWPLGTRQRVWLDVLLYTGLRRGDAVKLGRQHVRDGEATLVTEKTGTPVTLPILPVLARTLAAGPTGDLAFICGANGQPLTKESFGNDFREACNAAGVKGSAHGVRKIAASRVALSGATVPQMNAIFGWHGAKMALRYIEAADRQKLARAAMAGLANESATSIPAPSGKVRA